MRLRLGVFLTFGLVLAATACATPSAGPGDPATATPSGPTTPSGSAPATPTDAPSSAPASPSGIPAGASQLTVVVDDGTGSTTTWTLTCDPVGGDHPDPAGACAAVDEHRTALDPVPKGRMCAQVFGGPERATVSGSWKGAPVRAALSRSDACETARWDALVPLVPAGGR